MPGCSVPYCRNRSNIGYKLYGLPRGKSNEERRRQWEYNIGRNDLPSSAAVCEVHFTNDQFENKRQDGRRLLRWNAIPTLFPDENGILSIIRTGSPIEAEQELYSTEGIEVYEAVIEDATTVQDSMAPAEIIPIISAEQVTAVPNRHRNISILRKNRPLNKQGMKENSVATEESKGIKIANGVLPGMHQQILQQKKNGPISILRKNRLLGQQQTFETCVDKERVTVLTIEEISAIQDTTGMEETIIILEEPFSPSSAQTSGKEETDTEHLKTQLQKYLNENERLKHELTTLRETVNAFGEDQMYYLKNNTMKGFEWSDETILKGLKLYMACGKAGYDEVRKQNLPYPSIRTLQSRIQNIKFAPDMLDDVFGMLEVKAKGSKKEPMR